MVEHNSRVARLRNATVMSAVLTLAMPIVVQSLFQVLIGTVDLKMVGVLGSDAIAAVGMGRQVIMIIMILILAVSTGATAIVARNVGSGDQRQAARAAGNAFRLVLLFSAIMTPVGLLTAPRILELLGASPEVMGFGLDYMRIFYFSVIFFLSNFMARSVFQGAGNTKTPLVIDVIMNLVNVGANYLLIFGIWIFPEMGVAGAAMGSAIARFVGSVLGWGALLSGRYGLQVKVADLLGWDGSGMKNILSIGIPAAFQGMARNISNIALVATLARTVAGMAAISAFTVGMNITQYALMPGLAVGTAAASLTGINLGAKDPRRAEASGWSAAWFGAAVMGFFGAVSFIFAPWLLAFFSDDAEMIRVGVPFIRIIAVAEPFHAIAIILSRSMQGAGYTYKPFIITVVSWLLVRVPLAVGLAFFADMQATGVWIAIAASLLLSGLWAVFEYKKGRWKKVSISKENVGTVAGEARDQNR